MTKREVEAAKPMELGREKGVSGEGSLGPYPGQLLAAFNMDTQVSSLEQKVYCGNFFQLL